MSYLGYLDDIMHEEDDDEGVASLQEESEKNKKIRKKEVLDLVTSWQKERTVLPNIEGDKLFDIQYSNDFTINDYLRESEVQNVLSIVTASVREKSSLTNYIEHNTFSQKVDPIKLHNFLMNDMLCHLHFISINDSSGSFDNMMVRVVYTTPNHSTVIDTRYRFGLSDKMINSLSCHIGSYTNETFSIIQKFLEQNQLLIEKKKKVHFITRNSRGLATTSFEDIGKKFTPENYQDHVVNDFNYILSKIDQEETGRLVIFSGPPGTGKTYIIKAFIEALDGVVIYLPSEFITSITGPEMFDFLSERRKLWNLHERTPMYLILEDSDLVIGTREVGNMQAVSALLNLADGIPGKVLNLKFIATTNLPDVQIDNAIKRDGRLLKHVEVGELSPDRANALFNKLKGHKVGTKEYINKYSNSVTLAQIYAHANDLDKPILENLKKPMGFST